MVQDVLVGAGLGLILGCLLTPLVTWAWARVRLTDWLGFVVLASACVAVGGTTVEMWGLWSAPVLVLACVVALWLTRALSVRLRERPGYRPTGIFPFGRAPAGVRDWARDS